MVAIVSFMGMCSSADAQTYKSRVVLKGRIETTASPSACPALASKLFVKNKTIVGSATTLADAQSICDASRAERGPGSCAWVGTSYYSDSTRVYWTSDPAPYAYTNQYSDFIYGAACS